MWNSARKRKENEYSRARHGPLAAVENGEGYKKKGNLAEEGRVVLLAARLLRCFSTWAGVNYLDVVCARACVQAGEENACDHYET